MEKIRRSLVLMFFCLLMSPLCAQILYPGHFQADYYDVLRMKNDINGPITYRPTIIDEYKVDSALSWDIWSGRIDLIEEGKEFIRPISPQASFSYSSGYADGYNDGAVWEGKGVNSSLYFGFTGKKGMLSFTFAPVVYYAQNKPFYIAPSPFGKNRFSYPFERKIDWVERYGDDKVSEFDFGQSEIRLSYRKVSLGLGTQNFIVGPSQVAPILMSNNAGGIPHIDFGTSGPVVTKIGLIEYKMFWGIMDESSYFDENPDNDQRYITGAFLGYRPAFIPGLSLGVNRVMYREMFDGDFRMLNLFASLWSNIEDDPSLPNDAFDQMASLMVDWSFKEYGIDIYLDWSRNDFPGTFTDLIESPERTRASTVGFVKNFDMKDGSLLRIVFEHTQLNKIKMSVATIGHPTYYVHSVVDNGYTHNGQIMGAYIGPGSNAHHVRIQHFTSKGRLGLNIDRVRFNDDYFIDTFSGNSDYPNDFRYRLGLDYLRFIGKLSLDASITYGYRRNWYYEDDTNQRNLNVGLKMGYNFNKSE